MEQHIRSHSRLSLDADLYKFKPKALKRALIIQDNPVPGTKDKVDKSYIITCGSFSKPRQFEKNCWKQKNDIKRKAEKAATDANYNNKSRFTKNPAKDGCFKANVLRNLSVSVSLLQQAIILYLICEKFFRRILTANGINTINQRCTVNFKLDNGLDIYMWKMFAIILELAN